MTAAARTLIRLDPGGGTLEAAIAAAQADLANAEAGAAIEWRLPHGDHVIAAGLSIGAAHVDLLVRGVGIDDSTPNARTVLQVTTGDVTLTGLRVEIAGMGILFGGPGATLSLSGAEGARASSLRLEGAAVIARGKAISIEDVRPDGVTSPIGMDLFGETVEVRGARVLMEPGSGPRVGMLVTGKVSAAVSDAEVRGVTGDGVRGFEACSPRVSLARIEVHDVTQSAPPPAGEDGTVAASGAIGIVAEATEELSATGLRVAQVSGDGAIGIRIVCAGSERTAITDVWVDGVAAPGFAAGLVGATAGTLGVRGVTAKDVVGTRAAGVWLAAHGDGGEGERAPGEAELDVSVVHAESILGGAGRAAGVRVFATAPTARVRVRDVFVSAVGKALAPGGAPPGAPPAAPSGAAPASLHAWAEACGALLASERATVQASHDDPDPGVRVRAGSLELPALPADEDVVGLHMEAAAEETDPLAATAFGAAALEDSMIRRVAGVGVRIDGGMRSASLRRTELWQSVRAARVEAEDVLIAEVTAHAHDGGVELGPGEVRAYNTLVSALSAGPAITLEAEALLTDVKRVLTDATDAAEDPRVRPLGPLPYVAPGSGGASTWLAVGMVPADEDVALQLSETALAALPAPAAIPGDPSERTFLGAHEPEAPARCDARDPEPRAWAEPRPSRPADPAASYLARDAEDFLALMLDRARTSMRSWTDRGAADMTTMLFELFADRLDHAAYKQERAAEEGFLGTARLRRSVEDHARALDAAPDPGLSATAMVRFRIDVDAIPPDRKATVLSAGGGALVPVGTLVANTAEDDAAIVFATEEELLCVPGLDALSLGRDAPKGATSAQLAWVDGMEHIGVGRWLVLLASAEDTEGHVVRVTKLERGTDLLHVQWDPRRRLPAPLSKDRARVLANVVPAHHGLPLLALGDLPPEQDRLLGRYRRALTIEHDGRRREAELPFHPVSVQARGYPLPGDEARAGAPVIRAAVEGDPWTRVEDLSLHGASDEVFTLRSATGGGQVLLFGDGTNGSALPARITRLDLDLSIGKGRAGNVGPGRLVRLLRLGAAPAGESSIEEALTALPGADRDDLLRRVLLADNPLAAIGGRDAEDLDVLRERAPRTVMDAQSAVTAADFERLLLAMPEVRAARARVSEDRLRPVVRTTVLLRDEDTLDADEALRDERLRRWALVRRRLEEIRLLGVDVEAAPPRWVPLDLDIAIDAAPNAEAGALRDAVLEALAGNDGLFDPDRSGLGGDVHLSRVYQATLAVPGVVAARVLRFRRLAPFAPERLAEGVIPIGPDEVAVLRAPRAGAGDGLLTLTVCGGLR